MAPTPAPTPTELDRLCTFLAPAVAAILTDLGELHDNEPLERLTCELLVPCQDPEAPAELGEVLVEAVEGSRAPAVPSVLAALSRLGRETVADPAREALSRLPAAPEPGQVGDLRLEGAALLDYDDLEVQQLRFERADGTWQLGALFIESDETGGAAVDGQLTSPTAERPPFMPGPDGTVCDELALEDGRERARTALARTAAQEIEVGHELGVCLPLLSLGLTGSPDGLPPLAVAPPEPDEEAGEHGPLYVDPMDEDAFELLSRGLLMEFEDWLDADGIGGAEAQELCFAAESALHWKWGYSDGRLGTWTAADVNELLLDYASRKLPSDEQTVSSLPSGLAELLRMLETRGSLAGEPLETLLEEIESVRGRYAAAARDPGNWGLAKSVVAQMQAEGVEPGDPEAMNAWMEDFNSRPFEERDRVVGPALGRMGAPSQPEKAQASGSGKQQQQQRGKRKAARAARRRNRR